MDISDVAAPEVRARRRILVLGYHSVSGTWPAVTSVRPQDLAEQLSALVRRGFRGATLTEALTAPRHTLTLVVTFDDAHRSVFELGRPILARMGLPGTIFVPTSYPGSGRLLDWDGYARWLGTEHEHELACMDWDQLRELARDGWEIGSHSRSHPRLTQLHDDELESELRGSREDCEAAMGRRCVSVAYPYSDVDARVAAAAHGAGYAIGATMPRHAVLPLPLLWPRVGVYHGENAAVVRRRAWRRAHPLADAGIGVALAAARGMHRRGA
jgi:peptidoglycan/xylan/chitin deacetylase (PgdA/CDA1 family)